MARYRVIGHPRTRTMRVLWALEELGLPYEHDAAPPQSEAVRGLNPGGKVPVLVADGVALTDSVAIVQYLADANGRLTHPAGTIPRALQDGLTQFAVDEVDGALWTAAKHRFALPEDWRVPEIKQTARREFARAMKTLEARLGDRPFVTGEDFTVPDLILGHCAGWAEAAGFELPGGTVGAYFERLRGRPALARALAAAAGR